MAALQNTSHAERRLRQSGFREGDVELLVRFGTHLDESSILLLDKDVERQVAELQRAIQDLERLRGCKVILAGNAVVTCYRPTERHKKAALRRFRRRLV